MTKKHLSILICSLGSIISACSTTPYSNQESHLDPNKSLNSIKFTMQGQEILPTVSIFFTAGQFIDIKAGSMPYYWLSLSSDEQKKIISRDPITMASMESGKKMIAKDSPTSTKIKRISYGSYDPVALDTFLNSLQSNNYVLNVEIKGSKKEGQQASNESNNIADTANKITANNDEPLNKASAVPYMIFSVNKNDLSNFEAVTPSNIFNIAKNKNLNNFEFYLAAYPSFYELNPGDDLLDYLESFSNKIKSTPLDINQDCDGFIRYPGSNLTIQNVKNYQGNCPYLKYWLVTDLITAKNIQHLNKEAIIKEISGYVGIPDNSLSEIKDLIWNSADNSNVKISFSKANGSLLTSSMQFNSRTESVSRLSWDCAEKNGELNCRPAGPSYPSVEEATSMKNEIPVYGTFNLRPDHLAKLIKEVPRFKLKYEMVEDPIK